MVRREELFQVAGDDAAGAVAAAQPFGFPAAVVAVEIGRDAGAVTAQQFSGGCSARNEAFGAAERAQAVGAGGGGEARLTDGALGHRARIFATMLWHRLHSMSPMVVARTPNERFVPPQAQWPAYSSSSHLDQATLINPA